MLIVILSRNCLVGSETTGISVFDYTPLKAKTGRFGDSECLCSNLQVSSIVSMTDFPL